MYSFRLHAQKVKKALIIQLDSVSLDVLKLGIEKGYMPFVKRLINEGYNLREMFSGIPSTTPASQVNLFYGVPLLPGFRFVMKKEKTVFTATDAEAIDLIEKSPHLQKHKGLLRDGVGVMSIFSGGSTKSISTNHVAKNLRLDLAFLLHILNPLTLFWRILSMLVIIIIEKKENKSDKAVSLLKPSRIYPFYRVLHEILVSEMGYYYVRKALKSDDRIIFTDFTGYDEIAHHHGGYSNSALFYLSIMDLYIKGCYERMQKINDGRELVILSDHGQAPCVPVEMIIGSSFGEKITSFYPQKTVNEHILRYKSDHLQRSDLYILNSGGLSLLYLPNEIGKLERSQVEKEFPDLSNRISKMDQVIEFVLVRQNGLTLVKRGKDYSFSVETIKMLLPYFTDVHLKQIMKWLSSVMSGPYAPDICVIAKILGQNKVVDFETQLSSHGAIGGYQTQSFILSKNIEIKNPNLPDIDDLHDALEEFIYSS